MSKQDLLKGQTCVLRVNIHCEGCKRKVKKLLQKTNGVYSTSIDAEQGKVTVMGNVDPATLIKKLEKSGKHAELWGPQQKAPNNLDILQLKNMQLVQKDNKAQKGVQQGMEVPKEIVVPSKDQKAVKFDMPHDDDFGDNLYDDNVDDEFEVEEHQLAPSSKTVVVKGGGGHVHAPDRIDSQKGQDQAAVNIPVVVKDKKGKDNIKGYGHHKSHGGGGFLGFGGLFRGISKKSNKGVIRSSKDIRGVKESGGKVGVKEGVSHSQVCSDKKVDKKETNKNDGGLDVNGVKEVIQEMEVGLGKDKGGDHGGDEKKSEKGQMGDYPVGQMDQMVGNYPKGQMVQMVGSYPMGQAGQVGAVPNQGMPASAAMNNGYYQGPSRGTDMSMGMGQGNMYEQQHYMTPNQNPMMAHQRSNMGYDMQHWHGRPHPQEVNYVPPMPPPGSEPYSLYFSDENPTGCSIM